MDDKTIRKHIGALREEGDITQEEMAARLGISLSTYRRIEKGGVSIINEHMDDLARELGVSTEKLVLGYDPIDPDDETALEDIRGAYQTRYQTMVDRYEEALGRQREELEGLKNLVGMLQEQVKDKNEIIALLRKQAGRKS